MKKKLIGVTIIILISILKIDIVKGEKFIIGDYITSTYVKMTERSNTKYLTVQFIKTTNGEITYCIEPFVLLDEQIEYQEMNESNLSLTPEDIIKIKLISYYGYGYHDRTEPRWYAYTQVLIWQTVSKNADIYFTNTLNGNRTNKFDTYLNMIMHDVEEDLKKLNIQDEYRINLGADLILENISDNYTFASRIHRVRRDGNNILVKTVTNTGTFTYQKINNYYTREATFYSGNTSQKVLIRGNANGPLYTSNIVCLQGKIKIIVQDKYNIIDPNNKPIITYNIRLGDINYKNTISEGEQTKQFGYGTYNFKIEDISNDYTIKDIDYSFELNDNNLEEIIYLIPELKKTNLIINDYICEEDNCIPNKEIKVNLLDENNNLIKEVITNELGQIKEEIIKGTYYVYQPTIEGYEEQKSIKVEINNLDNEYTINIYNHKIIEPIIEEPTIEEPTIEEPTIEDPIIEEEIIPKEESIEEIEVPYTGIDDIKVLFIITTITIISLKVLKRICI